MQVMKSMTGFGRGEARQETTGTTWVVECSSVNRKQLEISISLPKHVADLESLVRNLAATFCSRGRVNIQIRADRATASAMPLQIDVPLATSYMNSLRLLAQQLGISADLSLAELIRLPGILVAEPNEEPVEEVWPVVEAALAAGLRQMVQMRATEGSHLRQDIETRLVEIESLLQRIQSLAPQVPEQHRQVLRLRLEKAGLPLPLDDERLVREIALFADRCDISEELSRAESHLRQFQQYLDCSEPSGRSLDFLMQEFFREFNTIGSKCSDATIAHHVVSAKSELEKIREQVQNLE